MSALVLTPSLLDYVNPALEENGMRLGVLSRAIMTCGLAAGCASSTGILPAGPETYTLSEKFAPVRGGSDEAQRVALTKANDYCAAQGRQFVPSTMGQGGPNGYTVTFRCLAPNDPAVTAYRLQQAPNVIIEQRNR
jgi:hypothetical protein